MLIIFQAIIKFARARHPGIYKPDYIDALYTSFHENKPVDLVCPLTPEWKSISDPDVHAVAVSATTDNYVDILQQVHPLSFRHNLFSFSEDMVYSAASGLNFLHGWMLEKLLLSASLYASVCQFSHVFILFLFKSI